MKRFLALLLTFAMAISMVTFAYAKDEDPIEFKDGGAITYDEAVGVMAGIGIINGYADGTFLPGNTLTRGAAAKIICSLVLGADGANALATAEAPFVDVPADHVFAGHIAYCVSEGIVSGYEDGTFRPAGTLSSNAFMKMLLGALGYDSEIEGYTGPNWTVNVVKQVMFLGLEEGLTSDFVGTKAVTREEACLYAFNTLLATKVEYDKKTEVSIGDILISNEVKKSEPVPNTGRNTIAADGEMQFAEQHFPDLVRETGKEDDFGRPANHYTYAGKEVGLFARTPEASYTDAVACHDIYDDLKLSDNERIDHYFVDGVDNLSALNFRSVSASNTASTGAVGVRTEVYWDKDTNDLRIIELHNYIGEVEEIETDKYGVRTVTVRDLQTDVLWDFECDEFEVGDVVIYDFDKSENEIRSMVLASIVKDVVVTKTVSTGKFVGSAKVWVRAADMATTHINSDGNKTNAELNPGNVVDLYLTGTGYVLWAELKQAYTKLGVVLGMAVKEDIYDPSCNTYYAKILKSDGKIEEMQVGSYKTADDGQGLSAIVLDTDAKFTTAKAALVGSIVEYNMSADKYILTRKATATNPADVDIQTGKVSFTVDSTKYYVDDDTTFLVQSGTGNAATYKAYVGSKAVPVICGDPVSTVVFCEENHGTYGIADLVFVGSGADISTTSSGGYVLVYGSELMGKIVDANESYTPAPSVLDGEQKTLYFDHNDTPLDNYKGFNLYTSVVYSSSGIVVPSLSEPFRYPTDSTRKNYCVEAVVTSPYAHHEISLDGKFYTVAEDVEVWQVNMNNAALGTADTITKSKIEKVEANPDPGHTALAIIKDDEIVTLFHRVTTDGGIDPDAPVVTPDANDLGEFNFNYIKLPVNFADETYAKKLDVFFSNPKKVSSLAGATYTITSVKDTETGTAVPFTGASNAAVVTGSDWNKASLTFTSPADYTGKALEITMRVYPAGQSTQYYEQTAAMTVLSAPAAQAAAFDYDSIKIVDSSKVRVYFQAPDGVDLTGAAYSLSHLKDESSNSIVSGTPTGTVAQEGSLWYAEIALNAPTGNYANQYLNVKLVITPAGGSDYLVRTASVQLIDPNDLGDLTLRPASCVHMTATTSANEHFNGTVNLYFNKLSNPELTTADTFEVTIKEGNTVVAAGTGNMKMNAAANGYYFLMVPIQGQTAGSNEGCEAAQALLGKTVTVECKVTKAGTSQYYDMKVEKTLTGAAVPAHTHTVTPPTPPTPPAPPAGTDLGDLTIKAFKLTGRNTVTIYFLSSIAGGQLPKTFEYTATITVGGKVLASAATGTLGQTASSFQSKNYTKAITLTEDLANPLTEAVQIDMKVTDPTTGDYYDFSGSLTGTDAGTSIKFY